MKNRNNQLLYRRMGDGDGCQWNYATGLDEMRSTGSYLLQLRHGSAANGLPLPACTNDHYIEATLIVAESGTDDRLQKNRLIGQTLIMPQCSDSKTHIFTRTLNCAANSWQPWAKMQQNEQVGQVTSLDAFCGSGLYSGVYSNGASNEAFLLVVIDNSETTCTAGSVHSVSQFKYALNVDGTFSYKTRTGRGSAGIEWGSWVDLGAADTTDIQDCCITAQKLSTALQEQINQNTANATKAANGAYWTSGPNAVTLNINKNDGTVGWQTLPAATETNAGVMSAEDKVALDELCATYYVDVDMLSNVDLVGNNVTVVEGTAGEVGAKYRVPIAVKGGYGITLKFKMPDDLHTAAYERELISFGTRSYASTNGFSVDLKSILPTNDLSQVSCKSTLWFYPTNSKTNNYAGRLTVGGTNRTFVGDAAFSIRYTGSLEGNSDIAYTLGENALRIYHTATDTDVLNIPYPEDGLITSLLDAINAHAEILEAVGYVAENLTLDSIIKCSAIPLVGTYESTIDAFPSFVLLKDDSWHILEVRFDASKGKGLDMIAGYIDGFRFYHNDVGYKLYGDGFFKSDLTFGCEGVVIKSIKVAPTLKSEIPNIVALCLHQINGDEKFNSTVTSGLSVTYGRTEELLRVFKKYGFKYVTTEQIHSYLKRGELLPHNCFTIIHDDYHYLREGNGNEYALNIRKLYLRNGIKAAFAIIPNYQTEVSITECLKDKDVFEFLIHDDYNLTSKQGYLSIADRIDSVISAFKSKLFTSNVWVYSGGEYDANTKMMLHVAGISMAYYTSGISTSGGISPMRDAMALPRIYMNDNNGTISTLNNILNNLVKR